MFKLNNRETIITENINPLFKKLSYRIYLKEL
jgi:hypothetical protein